MRVAAEAEVAAPLKRHLQHQGPHLPHCQLPDRRLDTIAREPQIGPLDSFTPGIEIVERFLHMDRFPRPAAPAAMGHLFGRMSIAEKTPTT